MAEKIKVAVLTDAGGAHLSSYFEALAKIEAVGSVVLGDPSGASEASARAVLGDKLTRVERSHHELLAAEKPPLSLVSVESVQGPSVVRTALEAGCHVMAEKPSCVNADDFAELVKLADSKHKQLMLALANRVRGTARQARKLIQGGAIGKPYGLELHIIADQTRLTKGAYHKSWFADKSRAGGGHLMWLGIHWLDLVMYLTGSPIVEVAAFTGNVGGQPISVEDSAAAVLRFRENFFGTITSGYYLDRGYHSHVKIWGSQGWLQLEPHGAPQLQWYTNQEAKVTRYEGPTESANYTPFIDEVVRVAAENAPPPITSHESLRAIESVFACYTAAATKRTQTVG